MSGFEIAGLVLGAIPVALDLLKHYENAAKWLNYWKNFRVEYMGFKGLLKEQEVLFKQNLRRLLLPLNLDDTVIEKLLGDPKSDMWKYPSIERQLEQRLQDIYEPYMTRMEMFRQTMTRLKDVLAVDSGPVPSPIEIPNEPGSFHPLTRMLDSEQWRYRKYRAKFARTAKKRRELLAELKTHNMELKELLSTSDDDSRLSAAREHAIVDERLCSFWLQAARIYSVLANRWDCACRATHAVNIPLEQSGKEAADLHLMWSNIQDASFESCQVRISEKTNITQEFEKFSVHRPPQRTSQPGTSITKKDQSPVSHYDLQSVSLNQDDELATELIRPPLPTIEISTTPTPASLGLEIKEISSICSSLNIPLGKGCLGYMLDKSQSRMYYVHRESTTNIIRDIPVTLDDIIQAPTSVPPTWPQRVRMSLAIATSFMKLLDTPWMSPVARRNDFVFSNDADHSPQLALEYDLLAQGSPQSSKGIPVNLQYFEPMEVLGIMLLELCFWSLLENQEVRTEYPPAETGKARRAFDVTAAKAWKAHVLPICGLDYQKAVDWCFLGHRETSSTQWRRNMFLNVIRPLENCHKYFSGE